MADELTHDQMSGQINGRIDGLTTAVDKLAALVTETRDRVIRIEGQREIEQHIADRAGDRAVQHAADRADDREADRVERAGGSPQVAPAPAVEPPSRLKRWSLVVVIAGGVVGLLGGLRSALEVVINVGHATIVAILHHP